MKLRVNDDSKLESIQRGFNQMFPYLKLEFLSPMRRGDYARALFRNGERTIGNSRTVRSGDGLLIIPDMTVADLEQQFTNIYGLKVQVYRKSGKVWLETTFTDGWSLQEQNIQGEQLSSKFNA